MKTIITRIKRLALALCFVTPLVSWAATYSTYKDDATTGTSGAYGNANYQRFKINADWMFNTDDNDIAATADAVKLDSIKVYWHSGGHNNADIGKASGNEVDPYLVVTTPQGVIVGISAAGAKWTASGSSTFEFTDLVISPNAQYYYYFATDVSSLTVGGAMSGAKQARFTGAWHGANKDSVTSDTTVCVMDDGRYSIRCDFEVSAATATTITTTTEGVSLSTGSDPVVVKGAVADGVVTVASGANVPALTVVGEATTLKLTDSLTATYLYLPATTTIDASDVTFTMPGSDETEATTTLVNGKISAASNPSVTLPTPAEGYAFESPAYTDAGIAVTITKFADASLDIGSSTVNWSEVRPEGWVNSPVPKITVAYTDGGKIVFDEEVQAASIELNGADKLTIERSEGVNVDISKLNFINNASANVEFVNFTRIPTFGQSTYSSDTISISGSDTLTGAPSPISNNAAEGTFNFAQPLNFTGDGFYLFGNKTVNFNAGTDATFTRLVLGNSNGSKTQTVNQNAGTVTVTGNSGPTSNQASILLGHWGSTVALNTLGGTFTANNAISRLGWDGTATWAIGGGTSAATVNALGIQNGGNGHSGTGTLNIFQNGTLNLGSGGIDFKNSSNGGAINLAGGTIAASADLTIANSKAAGTILNQGKTTTINTDSNTVTLSAPLSGTGALTKTGSGVLKVTGAGTATGAVTVSGGTLRFEGSGAKIGTGNINLTGEGAKLELVPGEGNTITLAPQFLINTTGGNSTPVVEVGAGTVVIADTGTSDNGHFAYSTINILNGGDMQLTKGDLLGYNFTYPINIAAGGKLTISKRETFTRNLNLNGGSVYIVKNDADDRALDLYNGRGTITVTADSSIDSETDAATIWVRRQAANVTVNSGATLTLNAIVETTVPSADTNGGITKSGDGTLKLTKANTSTGTLAVNAGVLELDGGSWAGPVALAAGTTLNVVTESEIGPGGTIATFGSGSTFGEGVVVQINGETVDDAAIDANGVVTRVVPVTYVAITVPTVANTTITVTVGGEPVAPATQGESSNTYSVVDGATVTVTYTSDGYEVTGGTFEFTASEGYSVDTTGVKTTQYVASITFGETTKYTSLQAAVDAAASGRNIVLLASEEAGATVSREVTFTVTPGDYTYGTIVVDGDYILTTTVLEGKTRYSVAPAVFAVTINEVRTLYPPIAVMTGIEDANEGPIGTTVEILSGVPQDYVDLLPMFDLNTETGVFTKVADPVAAVYEGVIQQQVYRTLADAIEAAEAGQTVKLLADVTLTETQTIDKDLTLDLNEHNVASLNCRAFHVSAGAFVLTGSGMVSATADENVNPSTFPTSSSVIRVGSNTAATSFTLGENVTVTSDYCYGITYFGKQAQTVVIDGTVDVTSVQAAISGNGTSTLAATTLTVNGTVSATQDYAIYNPQAGTTAINGTVTGRGGVEVKGGTVTVGATAKITATGTPSYTQSNQDGTSTVGYAIASVGNSSYKQPAVVNVEDGATVNGTVIIIKENKSETYGTVNSAVNTLAIPEGFVWSAVESGYTLAVVQEVPVEAGAQTEPVDTPEAAEADAAKVVPTVPAAVAAKLSDDQETAYKALFEPKVVEVKVGDTTKYAVEVALKADVVSDLQTAVDAEAEDLATAAVAAAADATNGGKATVATTPGLYYVVEAGTEPNGTAPVSCTLAESGSTTLTIPNKGAKGFYKIRVSVTYVDVQE